KSEVRYRDKGRAVVVPFRTYDKEGGARVAAVRMLRKTELGGRTVTPVAIAVPAEDGERGVFLPTKLTGAVMLAATVTTAKGGYAWVPAVNSHDKPMRLPSKKELGTWVPLDDDTTVMSMDHEASSDELEQWVDGLGDSETPLECEDVIEVGEPSARALITKLLRVYRKLTRNTGDCPPATALDLQHHIDTGSAAPIMLKRRRNAQMEDKVIEDNVDKMLKAGVIEEGNGAWGFPVVLVRKKDGEVRFCVDHRALNDVTKKDVYPLPRIDETLEALGGALWFTTLDLRAGYWQILVAEDDKDKTAFTTKQGLYRFVRMPFGLTNAPSTFQRMMNSVLRGLTWKTCLVYLDDIVVFTRGSIEKHVVELASVLERLSAAGLTLKLKKCTFAAKSMEYLGHELSCEGVRPLPRLITAVQQFPRPTNATEVKRFVHLAGYYRRFVKDFGSIMAPLTKLLRKSVEWNWNSEQEAAFIAVKEILTTKPLLIYPNFRLPFRVVTDASKIGLGACLMQDHGEGWRPVAYASKVNSAAESNYGITELECLAVVWAIKLFRPYLYDRRFTIVTDHSALKWLMKSPNLTGKLHRWALTLQEYEFEVEYRPGSTNVVADALSRAPVLAAMGRRRRWRRRRAAVIDEEGVTVGDGTSDVRQPETEPAERQQQTIHEESEVARGETTLAQTEVAAAAEPAVVSKEGVAGDGSPRTKRRWSGMTKKRKNAHDSEELVGGDTSQSVTISSGQSSKSSEAAVGPLTRAAKRRLDAAERSTKEAATVWAMTDHTGHTTTVTLSEEQEVPRPTESASQPETTRCGTTETEQSTQQRHRQVTWADGWQPPNEDERSVRGNTPSPSRTNEALRDIGETGGRDVVAATTGDERRGRTRSPKRGEPRETATSAPSTLGAEPAAGVAPTPRAVTKTKAPRTTGTVTTTKSPKPTHASRSPTTKEVTTAKGGEQVIRVVMSPPLTESGGPSRPGTAEGQRQVRARRQLDESERISQAVVQPTTSSETLQLTDDEVMDAQKKSRLVQQLLEKGRHHGMEVFEQNGLVLIKTVMENE
ncbi:hypothetical protein PR001_g26291, partial [Phytophthora rubi]